MGMRGFLLRTLALLLLLMPVVTRPMAAGNDVWALLGQGGYVLLVRHAATEPGLADPPGFRLEDCATQRNLSPAGRAQALQFGKQLRDANIVVAEVLSSRWCRCLDTARLIAGGNAGVKPWPALDSLFDDREGAALRTGEVLRTVGQPRVGNVLLVTHQANITALTGEIPRMGEVVVARGNGGRLEVVGRIVPP